MSRESRRTMADIRHPRLDPKPSEKVRPKRRKLDLKKGLIVAIILLLIFLLVFFALDIKGSATAVYRGFKDVVYKIKNLALFDISGTIGGIENELNELDRRARFLSLVPKLKGIPSIIGDLKEIVDTVKILLGDFNTITSDGISLAFNGQGQELLQAMRSLQINLGRLGELGDSIQAKAAEFGVEDQGLDFINEDILKLSSSLDTLIGFLEREEPLHIVLLFENHSELRPSGGFAGSYGELVLDQGSITSLEVNDIYYPDKFLDLRVIPPLQLQTITPNFAARDTGWFFDFRQSAAKRMEYLEASDIYEDEDIQFDGVISLNVSVVEELLKLTGPIDVPEYELQLDHRNFLSEIQKEVEENKVPGENPKRVLQFAAPRLIESLAKIDGNKKSDLLKTFKESIKDKDIKFFFEDEAMEKLVLEFNAGGAVYEIEDGFVGDYLALVNTNVAGGKTDILVDQRATLRSEIRTDGAVVNELTLIRDHKGNIYSEPWYNHRNQNFFKFFTLPEAEIIEINGGEEKQIVPKLNYVTSGYSVDDVIESLESTREVLSNVGDYVETYQESRKRVFGTWFNLDPGESKVLSVNYQASKIPVLDGQKFKFVLDKQSGSDMAFEYLLAAPEGYYFQESGSSLYRQRQDHIPARLEIDLTLRKL